MHSDIKVIGSLGDSITVSRLNYHLNDVQCKACMLLLLFKERTIQFSRPDSE